MSTCRMPKASGTAPLATARLNLRPFKNRDSESVASWSCDAETLRYLLIPELDEKNAKLNILTWRTQYKDPKFMFWCIATANNDECVGFIDVSIDEKMSAAELSYAVVPEKRGKGYAAEAVSEVIRYLHDDCAFHRVMVEVNTANIASTRVAEKCGMELEGIHRDALTDRNGQFYDVAVFAHIA